MATGPQTDNAFTLLDQIVHDGGGGGPVTHTHTQEEGLYVISGKCTFNAGGHQDLQGTPGTFVSIPGNTEHSFTIDEPNTHVLNFYLPAGFDQLLIGLSHPAERHEPPPKELIPSMLPPAWLADKLSEEYGMDNVLGNPFHSRPDPSLMLTKPTPGATLFPFTANAKELPVYDIMHGRWTVLASGKQTGGSYCLLEVKFQQGLAVPPRLYKERDEMFYVFGGELSFLLNDRVVKAKTGSMVYIPSGTVYAAHVNSEEAHLLNLHTKSGFEELLELVSSRSAEEQQSIHSAKQHLLDRIGLQELKVQALF